MKRCIVVLGAGGDAPGRHLGQGTCFIEFGGGQIGGVDIDLLGSSHRARWFGRDS